MDPEHWFTISCTCILYQAIKNKHFPSYVPNFFENAEHCMYRTWRCRLLRSPPRQTLSAVTTVDFPLPFGPTVTLKFGPEINVKYPSKTADNTEFCNVKWLRKNKYFFIHNTTENHFNLFGSRFTFLLPNIGMWRMATPTDSYSYFHLLNLFQL